MKGHVVVHIAKRSLSAWIECWGKGSSCAHDGDGRDAVQVRASGSIIGSSEARLVLLVSVGRLIKLCPCPQRGWSRRLDPIHRGRRRFTAVTGIDLLVRLPLYNWRRWAHRAHGACGVWREVQLVEYGAYYHRAFLTLPNTKHAPASSVG